MPTYSIEVLVLKRRNLGEADRLLTLLSADNGKFTAIAKGIRKPHSRKSSHLELFNHSRVFLATGKSLDVLTQAETIESFQAIKSDYDRIMVASYISELVDKMVREGEPNPELFDALRTGLNRLAVTEQLAIERISILLGLLHLFGYGPQFESCLFCRNQVEGKHAKFVYDIGGLICTNCNDRPRGVHSIGLSAKAVALLVQANRGVNMTDVIEAGSKEVERALDEYISFILQRQLKSSAMSIG